MIGIIGGTGLENSELFNNPKQIKLTTKYGEPSSEILTGEMFGHKIALISRHGRQHTITPTNVNNRANIVALKDLGCDMILATTACGSLREDIKPGDFVLADQFIDFTKHRVFSFHDSFEPEQMQHCQMAEPYSKELREKIKIAAQKSNITLHNAGTIITIEGPRFSTKAESNMFRMWGADMINMSTATETILANEMGIPYAVIAISTDYDCWKEDEEPVSIEIVLGNFKKSVESLIKLIADTIQLI
ncbi:MAG: S-methyl-5'-thioadenosine phosphorylase [Bacteroidales bacterium]|nr:S-methyl-5'-thioadenosine phosphorylase [Bacteroidales bacterium]MDD4217641.1 S-methyl-5'-thioadenosine phosphorylase [Bacteroidales bacterium]MDY0142556.1 S-methyl-5'-thioadenosine phosphorylase [Bacteroidales bacterium]